MDEFAWASPQERQAYDVVLFYHMLMDNPGDNPESVKKTRALLEELSTAGRGLCVLHHSILAYPNDALYAELVGIPNRKFDYYIGEHVRIDVARTEHPIARGLTPWEMIDETYAMADAGPGSEVLLTMQHPKSMKTIAWTRTFHGSRVFCFQCGHDNHTWAHPSFAEVLRRGMLWCGGRL
jgi:type 1 glutamine amidotransferase